jgi:hypothetical protein
MTRLAPLTPENLRKRLEHYDSDDMLVDFTKGELREMVLLIDLLLDVASAAEMYLRGTGDLTRGILRDALAALDTAPKETL